jgi:hypothetical protein
MGLFSTNKVNKAQISPLPEPSVQAAVGNSYSRNAAAPNMIGSWYTYQSGQARNRAISVPAISRSRDLMASVLASMELEMCTEIWNGNEMETVPLAPRTWLKQLDPEMPNSFCFRGYLMTFFFGRCFLYITSRTKDGYMASATRLPQVQYYHARR